MRHLLNLLGYLRLTYLQSLHSAKQTSKESVHVQLHEEQNRYLPADTVESNQAKQVCEADLRALKRKGCKWKAETSRWRRTQCKRMTTIFSPGLIMENTDKQEAGRAFIIRFTWWANFVQQCFSQQCATIWRACRDILLNLQRDIVKWMRGEKRTHFCEISRKVVARFSKTLCEISYLLFIFKAVCFWVYNWKQYRHKMEYMTCRTKSVPFFPMSFQGVRVLCARCAMDQWGISILHVYASMICWINVFQVAKKKQKHTKGRPESIWHPCEQYIWWQAVVTQYCCLQQVNMMFTKPKNWLKQAVWYTVLAILF